MKKSRNFTWMILGIITILLGIIIPFVVLNQSCYYEIEKDSHAGSATFYVTITSKEEIENVHWALIEVSYHDGEEKEYEIYQIKSGKVDNKFTYEFKYVETENWVFLDRIESVELCTLNEEFEVDKIEISKKIGLGTKIPIAIFACVIGAFMIFVNFFNNNTKNRTNEIKELISSAYNTHQEIFAEQEEILQDKDSNVEENKEDKVEPKAEEVKACAYCGTLADANDKVCTSCGAKFKKK